MISFEYQNPVKILYGEGSISKLGKEILKYGKTALLIYGGGSIKKSGVYEEICTQLRNSGIAWAEYDGVTEATREKLYEAIQCCQDAQADVVIGIGGGACIDMAKSVAVGAGNPDLDIWNVLTKKIPCDDHLHVLPIGAVVSVAGSGSEMDGNSEIDDLKTGVHGSIGSYVKTYPAFSILDPDLTATVPFETAAYHAVTVIVQTLEQYLCSTENTPIQDGFCETICRTVMNAIRDLKASPDDANARGQILWASALGTSRLLGRGKEAPWHAGPVAKWLGRKAGLSYSHAIELTFPKYMAVCCSRQIPVYYKFAVNIMGVDPREKSMEEVAREGVEKYQAFLDEMGLAHTIKDFGISIESIESFREGIEYLAARNIASTEDLEKMASLIIG